MATTYGRSPGGYIWAVAEPVGAIAVLSVAFSIAFHAPSLGSNFPLFYATGYLPFMMYSDLAAKVATSIRFSRPLLFYPRVTYLDAIIGRWALNFLTHLIVFVVVLAGIALIFGVQLQVRYEAVALSLMLAGAIGGSVGVLNCFMFMRFPLWERLWGIANRPLFIISGVFFVFESIPEPFRGYLWYNPLVHLVGLMRRGIYPDYHADYVSPAYVLAVSLVVLVLGLQVLRRFHKELINQR